MKTFKIHFLNTIWSDAIILERNKKYGFVDTGSLFYYPMIKDYLGKLEIKDIEFIILTHFHSDHYGCLSQNRRVFCQELFCMIILSILKIIGIGIV